MSNSNLISSIQPVRVYSEPKSTDKAMQRRYWRQSNEAEAVGHPYLVIRPATRYAPVVCDWITARQDGRSPVVTQFVPAVQEILGREYPEVSATYLGAYTVIERVPKDQADSLAQRVSALSQQPLAVPREWVRAQVYRQGAA